MKRFGLIAMLLLGVVPHAYADNDIYNNITKHRRGDDVLQADTSYCSQMLGAPQTARRPRKPTSCMLSRGWRRATADTQPSRLRPSAAMKRPTERRALPDGVPYIQPRAALDQQPHYRLVAAQDGLMQRRRVRMVAFEVVAVGILAGVEQQANDLRVSVLRGQGERAVARFGVRGREQTGGVLHAA